MPAEATRKSHLFGSVVTGGRPEFGTERPASGLRAHTRRLCSRRRLPTTLGLASTAACALASFGTSRSRPAARRSLIRHIGGLFDPGKQIGVRQVGRPILGPAHHLSRRTRDARTAGGQTVGGRSGRRQDQPLRAQTSLARAVTLRSIYDVGKTLCRVDKPVRKSIDVCHFIPPPRKTLHNCEPLLYPPGETAKRCESQRGMLSIVFATNRDGQLTRPPGGAWSPDW